jgi:hypothetical protein
LGDPIVVAPGGGELDGATIAGDLARELGDGRDLGERPVGSGAGD